MALGEVKYKYKIYQICTEQKKTSQNLGELWIWSIWITSLLYAFLLSGTASTYSSYSRRYYDDYNYFNPYAYGNPVQSDYFR